VLELDNSRGSHDIGHVGEREHDAVGYHNQYPATLCIGGGSSTLSNKSLWPWCLSSGYQK